MDVSEKKYLVSDLSLFEAKLKTLGATEVKRVQSSHYYGHHDGSDVEKFVVYPDHSAIHVLKEQNGTFTLTEDRAIADKAEGLAWLKDRGYTQVDMVDMDYTDYAYEDGTIGLYSIDHGAVYSVILTYPADAHDTMEKKLGLVGMEQIALPYNKYLEVQGKLRSMPLL